MHDDATGRFTSGGDSGFNKPGDKGSSGDKIYVVVKPVDDIKAERKKTLQWYKDNLQGKTVTHEKLGEIYFNSKAGYHSINKSGSEKLALVKYLPQLIENGTCRPRPRPRGLCCPATNWQEQDSGGVLPPGHGRESGSYAGGDVCRNKAGVHNDSDAERAVDRVNAVNAPVWKFE